MPKMTTPPPPAMIMTTPTTTTATAQQQQQQQQQRRQQRRHAMTTASTVSLKTKILQGLEIFLRVTRYSFLCHEKRLGDVLNAFTLIDVGLQLVEAVL